ncbi:uncharacterized protein An18g00720 [Aspergillus niger]|uniref:Contig An18c0030, genomic contig n=2 Tax=Aspergillus niger TaxID=5061 RepID=A2R9Z1_ASPNC|nr:uncharacterized protein An18g00720 [Aspergillus niger]CAK43147.1 unnamed protein product [Aspergillus niger]
MAAAQWGCVVPQGFSHSRSIHTTTSSLAGGLVLASSSSEGPVQGTERRDKAFPAFSLAPRRSIGDLPVSSRNIIYFHAGAKNHRPSLEGQPMSVKKRVVVAALQALAAVLLRPSTSPLLRLKSFRCRGLELDPMVASTEVSFLDVSRLGSRIRDLAKYYFRRHLGLYGTTASTKRIAMYE